ncbi:MAG: signal peptidase II [Kiritimatiellae bacterium]|nr:signal peptidase II [Kiritimatiellia bacterium]
MRLFIYTFVAVANLVLLDQAVKHWAIVHFDCGRLPPAEVVDGFWSMVYVENRGAAWGMFQGAVWPLAVFAVAALALLLWRRKDFFAPGWTGALCEVLLYAGLVGNLFDRVFRGCVIDMFDFHFRGWYFPVFNVADIYITFAAFLLIATSFRKDGDGR